jgi:DNA-binding GntR family transcriptional regulator
MQQKLPPGAKLPEGPLCEAFDCSRTQIRRILVVLAERGVLTLCTNRGAFVSSQRQAKHVTCSRRGALLSAHRAFFSGTGGSESVDELRAIVRAGAAAEARGNWRKSIRLSGEFHLHLAEVAGNAVLAKFLKQLVARTSLIIGLYGSRNVHSCLASDHVGLVDALAERDGTRAAELMDLHLRRVEEALNVRDAVGPSGRSTASVCELRCDGLAALVAR